MTRRIYLFIWIFIIRRAYYTFIPCVPYFIRIYVGHRTTCTMHIELKTESEMLPNAISKMHLIFELIINFHVFTYVWACGRFCCLCTEWIYLFIIGVSSSASVPLAIVCKIIEINLNLNLNSGENCENRCLLLFAPQTWATVNYRFQLIPNSNFCSSNSPAVFSAMATFGSNLCVQRHGV